MNTVEENRKTIMRLTGMTDYQYNKLQFDVGMAFLDHECMKDAASVKLMSTTPLFWQWFKNIYGQRDDLWLRECSIQDYNSYTKWQSVKNINVYPNRFIYEQAYEQFAAKLR